MRTFLAYDAAFAKLLWFLVYAATVSASGTGTNFSRHMIADRCSTPDKILASKRSSSLDEEETVNTAAPATASQTK